MTKHQMYELILNNFDYIQVYTMVCIYYQYKEYKEGAIRPNAAPDLVKFHFNEFYISAAEDLAHNI